MNLLAVAILAAFAAVPLASASPAPFEDGDTVVFLGDSITHGGRYHEFIADFYRTRYPARRIRICGDTPRESVVKRPFEH